MNLYKREGSKVWWAQFTHRKRRYQFSTKETNRRKAEDYAVNFKSNVTRGEAGLIPKVETPSPTIGELLDRLKKHYAVQGKDSVQTLSHLAHARIDFGAKRSDTITKEAIQAYQKKRQEAGAANATINRATEILHKAYTNAGLTPPDFKELPENNARQGFFTRSEVDRLLTHLPEDLRDFCLWSFLTGMRCGETKSLAWSSVTDNTIRLKGEDAKTKKPRTIVCSGELVDLLQRRREARTVKLPSGAITAATLIFHRDGGAIGEFRKSWKTATKKAGCPGRIFHDLRRSGVRNLIRAGVPQNVAMRISGHRTDSTFRRYDICNEDDLAQAMISLQKFHEAEKVVAISAGGKR
jgi:integrase